VKELNQLLLDHLNTKNTTNKKKSSIKIFIKFILFTSRNSRLSNKDKKSSFELFTVPDVDVAAVVELNKSFTIAAIRLLSLDVDTDRDNTGGVCCLFIGINDISFGC